MTTIAGRSSGERLLQHVAGLRQRALGGVDQQQHAVDHRQGPLDLATEVGVAGRVDEVDLDALPGDRGGLGEDGDAPLALLIVGVHDPVDQGLVGGEGAGGAQERVDEVVLPWSTWATRATLRRGVDMTYHGGW